eukprot:2608954-Rhodomonas_salina.1
MPSSCGRDSTRWHQRPTPESVSQDDCCSAALLCNSSIQHHTAPHACVWHGEFRSKRKRRNRTHAFSVRALLVDESGTSEMDSWAAGCHTEFH